MPVCGVMVSLCVASGVCPGAWFLVFCAPIWIVPVVLLPVACSVMRGVWRPGVLVCGDSGILESDVAPSWCMVCGGPMLPIG